LTNKNLTLMKLQTLNPSLFIESVFSPSFTKYGKILDLNCSKDLISKLDKDTTIPEKGNVYIPYIREWENDKIFNEISSHFDEEIEIGYCNGQNTELNALEWHSCNEINIYSTPVVLFLAKLSDLDDNFKIDSSKVKTFYVPKNTAIVLYNSTLHFAPCKVEKEGFKAIIILSNLTNTELEENNVKFNVDKKYEQFILKNNKYIICHKDATYLTKQGVKPNIIGTNLKLTI